MNTLDRGGEGVLQTADISTLLFYAQRYAISRHTYASAEVAQLIVKYARYLDDSKRLLLIEDIRKATKDEYSTNDWEQAMEALL